MNIIVLQMLFRQVINYLLRLKIKHHFASNLNKIYIFTPSIVNRITMYIDINQIITNKLVKNDKH